MSQPTQERLEFSGPEYRPGPDQSRLTTQHGRIRDLVLDGRWRTLPEICVALKHLYPWQNFPENSVQAQLRHLRKQRFGSHVVEKRRTGDESLGLYEWRVSRPEVSR